MRIQLNKLGLQSVLGTSVTSVLARSLKLVLNAGGFFLDSDSWEKIIMSHLDYNQVVLFPVGPSVNAGHSVGWDCKYSTRQWW